MAFSESNSPAIHEQNWSAFVNHDNLSTGTPSAVVAAVKRVLDQGETQPILIFDNTTGQTMEPDLRGSVEEVLARLSLMPESGADAPDIRGRGRPRLGVVAREVTLLPRHWAWLGEQPGGASVALRKLVETARTENSTADRRRRAREATYRFMTTMTGNQPGYEEAIRALFAGDSGKFNYLISLWPPDIHHHIQRMADPVFDTVLEEEI